jgi:hypothetical protein
MMPTITLQRKKQSLPTRFEPQFWLQADGRSAAVREIKRRRKILRQDVGCDSYQKELLIDRLVFSTVMIESMELEATETGRFDSGRYVVLVNTAVGLLKALGLERKFRDAKTLTTYLAERDDEHS